MVLQFPSQQLTSTPIDSTPPQTSNIHHTRLKMFRAVRAPSEPAHGKTLSEFGYHINEKGECINTTTGEYFDFFHTDSERANDSRRGAFQECLRAEIAATLKNKHGIEEIFIGGQDGAEVFTTRPTGSHVRLLATELSELRQKQDVIVVVGESTQDCGIWAWRLVQREGGMEEGSLVGLAKKVTVRANNDVKAANENVKVTQPVFLKQRCFVLLLTEDVGHVAWYCGPQPWPAPLLPRYEEKHDHGILAESWASQCHLRALRNKQRAQLCSR